MTRVDYTDMALFRPFTKTKSFTTGQKTTTLQADCLYATGDLGIKTG